MKRVVKASMGLSLIMIFMFGVISASAVAQTISNYSFEDGVGSNPSSWSGHNGRTYWGASAKHLAYVMEMNDGNIITQSLTTDSICDISSLSVWFYGAGKLTIRLKYSGSLKWSDLTNTGSSSSWTNAYYISTDFSGCASYNTIEIEAMNNNMAVDYVLFYVDNGGPI